MTNVKNALFATSAMAVALSLVGCGGTAKIVSQTGTTERCYGIAKAGMNDCAGEGHGCAGQALATRSSGDFVIVPVGSCAKLVGGDAGGEGGGGEGT
jgi:Predicted integral membrane protein